jgi:hypothetical protein
VSTDRSQHGRDKNQKPKRKMNAQTATPYMIKQAEKEMKMLKTQLIVEAGQIIREYDKDLAERWDWAPFSFQRLAACRT